MKKRKKRAIFLSEVIDVKLSCMFKLLMGLHELCAIYICDSVSAAL